MIKSKTKLAQLTEALVTHVKHNGPGLTTGRLTEKDKQRLLKAQAKRDSKAFKLRTKE